MRALGARESRCWEAVRTITFFSDYSCLICPELAHGVLRAPLKEGQPQANYKKEHFPDFEFQKLRRPLDDPDNEFGRNA